jgi:hypothetical protein
MKKLLKHIPYCELFIWALLLVLVITCSCQDEDIRLSPDCYKLDNLSEYLSEYPKGNTTVWAIDYDGNRIEYACSWYEAQTRRLQYNCDNYPKLWKDTYIALHSNGTPCKSI